MACSVKGLVRFGISLAVLDILHGLATLLFYGYFSIVYHFYLCPTDMALTDCHNKIYIYDQRFAVRTYIGVGEGCVTFIFDIIYIVALSKHLTCLMWTWLLKSFVGLGINVFYISRWTVHKGNYALITHKTQEYDFEIIFPEVGEGLTILQLVIMVLYCIVGALFTCKVSEERSRNRMSIRPSSHIRNVMGLSPVAPPGDVYGGGDAVNATIDNHLVKHDHKALEHQLSSYKNIIDEVNQANAARKRSDYDGQANTPRELSIQEEQLDDQRQSAYI